MAENPSTGKYHRNASEARQLTSFPIWIHLVTSKGAILGLVLLLVSVIAALMAPIIAPYPYDKQHIALRLSPPSWDPEGSEEFLLGTDTLGRDVLSRLLHGARISLFV